MMTRNSNSSFRREPTKHSSLGLLARNHVLLERQYSLAKTFVFNSSKRSGAIDLLSIPDNIASKTRSQLLKVAHQVHFEVREKLRQEFLHCRPDLSPNFRFDPSRHKGIPEYWFFSALRDHLQV